MRRFFIEKKVITEGTANITGNLFRHMAKVLRLKIGAEVTLVDEDGTHYLGTITDSGRENLTIAIEKTIDNSSIGTGLSITLYQGLPKGDKMEFILQKSTELGVAEIVPFIAERSVPNLPKERENERIKRWQRITLEAARQSGRTEIPRVSLLRDFSQVIRHATQPVKLLLWEEERANGLKQLVSKLPAPESIAVLVGPEGGFTREEAKTAMDGGFIPVTLGRRILRTETAAVAILAILQFAWGDIG